MDAVAGARVVIQGSGNVGGIAARLFANAGARVVAASDSHGGILCDDGLQHLALGRDLAIAVFDDRGIGNGWLLPAGLLREPWPPRTDAPFTPDMLLLQGTPGAAQPEQASQGRARIGPVGRRQQKQQRLNFAHVELNRLAGQSDLWLPKKIDFQHVLSRSFHLSGKAGNI